MMDKDDSTKTPSIKIRKIDVIEINKLRIDSEFETCVEPIWEQDADCIPTAGEAEKDPQE